MTKILLADASTDALSSLRLLLETRLNFETIIEARDMEHVLSQIEDTHPDGIILDWELPGRPTSRRISELRALIPNLKVIVINTRLELREKVLSEGADAFVCKTDPPKKLLEAMQKFFQGSGQTSAEAEPSLP